jgi:hypothetical protein
VHAAEGADGKSLWVIKDEGALADFLPEEDRGGLVSLTRYSTRERARWVAELVELRRSHVASREEATSRTWPGPLDDMLVDLVDDTARRIELLARDRGILTVVNERDHLQPCCAEAARALAPGWSLPATVSTQMEVEFTAWPRLGNVDVALSWPGQLPVLVELKCGSGVNALGECVWDAAKLAFAMQSASGSAMFLLAGAPVAAWQHPVRGTEFFADGPHEAALLRVLYGDWWREWEKRGDPQPSELPRRWWTEHVHTAPFTIKATPWQLRLAQVFSSGDDRLPWPRLI